MLSSIQNAERVLGDPSEGRLNPEPAGLPSISDMSIDLKRYYALRQLIASGNAVIIFPLYRITFLGAHHEVHPRIRRFSARLARLRLQ